MDLVFYLSHFLNLTKEQVDCILEIKRRYPHRKFNEIKHWVLDMIYGKDRRLAIKDIFETIYNDVNEDAQVVANIMNSGLQPPPRLSEILPHMEKITNSKIRNWIWWYLWRNEWQSLQLHQLSLPMLDSLVNIHNFPDLEDREFIISIFSFDVLSNFVNFEAQSMLDFITRILPEKNRTRKISLLLMTDQWNQRALPLAQRLLLIVNGNLYREEKSNMLFRVIKKHLETVSNTRLMNPGAANNPVADLDTIERYVNEQNLLPEHLAELRSILTRRALPMDID